MITITKKYEELEAWAPTLAVDVYDLTIDATTMTNSDHLIGDKLNKAPEGATFKVKFINVPSSFTTASRMFFNCMKLTFIDCSDFKNITDTNNMFYNCSGLTSIDTSPFTKVTNASYMFQDCSNLISITGAEAFTNINLASYMFQDCTNLLEIDCSAFKKTTNASHMFQYCKNLISITGMEAFTKVSNASYMFERCTNLLEIDCSAFKKTTNASYMFNDCQSLRKVTGMEAFTKVSDASYMFAGCLSLRSIDISGFGSLTNANGMFWYCSSLGDIKWGFTQPSSFSNMFQGCSKYVKDIYFPKNWDTNASTIGDWVGKNAGNMKLTGISWNYYGDFGVVPYKALSRYVANTSAGINKVTIDCSTMTNEDHKIGEKLNAAPANAFFDVTLINIPDNLTDAKEMFRDCPRLVSINIGENKISNAQSIFYGCSGLISVTGLETLTNVTNASYMFYGCSELISVDVKAFTQVTNTEGMFSHCKSLTSIDISNLTKIENTRYMCHGCTGLASISWGIIKPSVNNEAMFLDASATKKILVSDQATADWIKTNETNMGLTKYSTNLVTDIPDPIPYEKLSLYAPAFKPGTHDITIDCSTITNADHEIGEKLKLAPEGVTFNITLINVPDNFTYARNMFLNCKKLISVTGLEAFTNVENTKAMFFGCSELTSIDIKDFKNVTDASSMFWGCSKLTSIDTSAFINVTNAEGMFRDCIGLTSIDTQYFTKVTNAYDMFSGCSSLTSIDVSGFTKVVSTDFMLDYCTSLTGITWGNIKPAENDSMFSSASASKVIKVAGQSAVDWLKANETKMALTNYTTEFLPVSDHIFYEDLAYYAPKYTAEAHNITIDCSAITNEDHKIGEKLNLAPEGATFNVTLINVPDNFTDALDMFSYCSGLTSIDTSVFKKITKASQMFLNCSNLTSVDTSVFNNVTEASSMFDGCSGLTSIDISNLIKVKNTLGMFYGCTSLANITWGNIKPATNADMFSGASATKVIKVINQSTVDWLNTNKANMKLTDYTIDLLPISDPIPYNQLEEYISRFVIGSNNITIDCSTVTNEDHKIGEKLNKAPEGTLFNIKLINLQENFKNADNMFRDCTGLISIDIEKNNITNADNMFRGCTGLTLVDTSNLKNVAIAQHMFSVCTGLTSIDCSGFTKVIDAYDMFSGCSGLTSIDTQYFINVTNASNMFSSCTGFTSIDCSGLKNVVDSGFMFSSCSFSEADISKMDAIYDGRYMFAYNKNLSSITFGNDNPPASDSAYLQCPIKVARAYGNNWSSVETEVENSKSTSKWPTGVTWYARGLPTFKFIRIA